MDNLKLIKKRRLSLGTTQKELSKLSGISQSMIAKIEAGRAEASYNVAKKIFKALDSLSSSSKSRAKDFMQKKIVFCDVENKIEDVISIMRKKGISQLPVLNTDKLEGYISEGILLDNIDKTSRSQLVKEIMSDAPPVVLEDTTYETIVHLLKEFPLILIKPSLKNKKYKGENNGFIGLITKTDVLWKH
ncbi:CBS domain-containing protein [Candidatus Pacearchaeota archaeon]|nr:CBS domain-containing protein [Candidatus Pacearchaeota archaeon]